MRVGRDRNRYPGRDRDVVDQPGAAEMDGGEEARGTGEPRQRRQVGGTAQFEVIDGKPAGGERGDAALEGGGDGPGRLVSRIWERPGLLPLARPPSHCVVEP